MNDKQVKCPICGTEFEGGSFDDCPYCDWEYLGFESELDEDEYEEVNHTTIKHAKENFAKGLDIWGDPLPKKE